MSKNRLWCGSRLLAILFVIFSAFLTTYGQEMIAEIDLGGKSAVDDVRGMISGDSIFLMFKTNTGAVGQKPNSLWIYQSGQTRELNLDELSEKFLCGIISDQHLGRYYYFDANKNSVVVKALTYDEITKSKKINDESLELPGKLLGSYIDGDLYLICASKSDYTLRLIQIRDLKLIKETVFKITQDLVRDKTKEIAFMQDGLCIWPDQASAPIKIIKEKRFIYIVADEPYNSSLNTEMQPPFKTLISRLDLETGLATHKTFFEPGRGTFATFIQHDKIYRVVDDAGMRIDVFDFNLKKLFSKTLSRDEPYSGHIGYVRTGKNRFVTKGENIRAVVRSPIRRFIIADSLASDSTALTIGLHAQEQPTMPMVYALGPIVAMLSVLASAVVRELHEGPSINNYFYMKGTASGFSITNKSGSLKQVIDDYETSLLEQDKRFKFKGYLDAPGITYGFYQLTKSTKLQVNKFNSPLKAENQTDD